MAVVGEAHIIVRAITTQVKDDIRRGFAGVDDTISKTGKSIQKTFQSDFAREADHARRTWQRLAKTGFVLQTAIGGLTAGIGSLGGALGALVGAVGAAATSLAALSGIVAALPAALITGRLAFSGIGDALSKANQQASGTGKSLAEIREELQQLGFDSEDATLNVERATINLERARENLARTSYLPASSRARREAILEAREAELALRRAIDRKNDLEEKLKDPLKATSGGGGEDPFAGLLPSQEAFARYILSLKPLLTELKKAASDSFLPILQQQIERLVGEEPGTGAFFQILREGIEGVSFSLGQFAENFVDILLLPKTLENLSVQFDNVRRTISDFGRVFGLTFGGFLGLAVQSDGLTRRFVGFLERKAQSFSDFFNAEENSQKIQDFFDKAGDRAADLGDIFGNIFGFLGDLIESSVGPGSGGAYMLEWLDQATTSWATLDDRVGSSQFNAYLLNAVSNTRDIGRAFGEVIKIAGKLGSDLTVGRTFQILASGSEYLEDFLQAGVDAGPAFAELLKSLTQIISIFAEAGAIQIFFQTLNDFARAFVQVLENPVARAVIQTVGGITAVFLAIQTVKNIAVFAFKVVVGAILSIVPAAGTATGALAGLNTALTIGPLGAVLTTLSLIVAGITLINARSSQVAQDQINQARGMAATSDEITRAAMDRNLRLNQMMQKSLGELGKQEGLSLEIVDEHNQHIRYLELSYNDLLDGASRSLYGVERLLNAVTTSADDTTEAGKAIKDGFDKEELQVVREQFEQLGTALGNIASTDLASVSNTFRTYAESIGLSTDGQTQLLLSLGPLEDKIKEVALANGIALDRQGVLNVLMGKGRDAAFLLAGGFEGLAKKANDAKQKVDSLRDGIINFGAEQLDARQAERAFEDALDSVTEGLKENGKTLDVTTKAGRDNQSALDAIVKTGLELAGANFELHESASLFEQDIIRVKEEVEKAAIALGLSEEEAKNLSSTLVGSDYQIKIDVEAASQAAFQAALDESRLNYEAVIRSGGNPLSLVFGEQGFAAYEDYLKNPRGGKDGGLFSRGMFKRFYSGGMVSGPGGPRSDLIPAMLSNGEFVVNASSTEKYLPLLRAINREGQGGARLNNGGMGGPVINMTVNAAPDMNTSEIVNEVSRQIAFQLRSGVNR